MKDKGPSVLNLEIIVRTLKLKIRTGTDRLGTEVRGGYAGDLLSDVIANSARGDVWFTRQVHPNIVAVAVLKRHAGIIIVHGCEPLQDTLERAHCEGIPLMVSDLPGFTAIGMAYNLITYLRGNVGILGMDK